MCVLDCLNTNSIQTQEYCALWGAIQQLVILVQIWACRHGIGSESQLQNKASPLFDKEYMLVVLKNIASVHWVIKVDPIHRAFWRKQRYEIIDRRFIIWFLPCNQLQIFTEPTCHDLWLAFYTPQTPPNTLIWRLKKCLFIGNRVARVG